MQGEDEIEFASMFGAKFTANAAVEPRRKAEKRATMSDKQRARGGGRARSVQLNIRCTPAFKALSAGLASHMDVSVADVLEEAVEALAKKKGFTGGADA